MDALTSVPPHWGPVRIFLDGPPFWVVVALCLLFMRGWRVRRPGRITLLQLAVFPALVFAWHAWRLASATTATAPMMLAWIAGLVIGAWLGRSLVQDMRITPEGPHGLLVHSGDRSWLPLALGFFVFEFLVVRVFAWEPMLRQDVVVLAGYASVAGLLAGLFLGRLDGLLRTYRVARSAPSQRTTSTSDHASHVVYDDTWRGETDARSVPAAQTPGHSRQQEGLAAGDASARHTWLPSGATSSSDGSASGGGDGGGGGGGD